MSDTKHKRKEEVKESKKRTISAEELFGPTQQGESSAVQGLGDLWESSIDELRTRTYNNLDEAHEALKDLVVEKLQLKTPERSREFMSTLLAHPHIDDILRRELRIKG